eukprot:2095993-Heterocapsa_arctica.AAC.1
MNWGRLIWTAANATTFCSQPGNMPSLGQLASHWRAMVEAVPKTWAQVTGPFGAMWLSLKRLGWSMADPFNFTDDRGIQ